MSKTLKYLPELQDDEQLYIAAHMSELTEEQAERFAHVYRARRKDPMILLVTTLLGFFVIAGVQRFLLGQIGMGLLYLFTGGLCFVGTIVDALNYKKLAYEYNQDQADEVAMLVRGALPGGSPRGLDSGTI